MKKFIYGLMFLFALITMSCFDDVDDQLPELDTININISGLENLGSDFIYEGWLIVDGSPISTGVFAVNDAGELSQQEFQLAAFIINNATEFILTIEPIPDQDPRPSNVKLMSGAFNGESATLNTAIVGNFINASGSFFLRTPTDEEDGVNNGNDQNGVWFGTPGMPPTASLELPVLPEGWIYEGWVVADEGPLTTGTFNRFDTADNMSPFSGEYPGPPIPGEDFFENAPTGFSFPLDVRGKTVVISVEPIPDNSPAPFLLKPVVGIAGQETAPATHLLGPNLAGLPTGSVAR